MTPSMCPQCSQCAPCLEDCAGSSLPPRGAGHCAGASAIREIAPLKSSLCALPALPGTCPTRHTCPPAYLSYLSYLLYLTYLPYLETGPLLQKPGLLLPWLLYSNLQPSHLDIASSRHSKLSPRKRLDVQNNLTLTTRSRSTMDRDRILEPRAVEAMIAEGHTIVIFEDVILKLDSWLHRHPGGRLAILHMVGRDATDEMKAYVNSVSTDTAQVSQPGTICCLGSSYVWVRFCAGSDGARLTYSLLTCIAVSQGLTCCLITSINPYPAAPH